MPDLRGLSAREALRTLTRLGMTARMTGDGVVLEQAPAAGDAARRHRRRTLTLGRRPIAPSGGAAALTLEALLRSVALDARRSAARR